MKNIVRIFAIIDRPTKIGLSGVFVLMAVSAALEIIGVGVFLPLLQILVDPGAIAALPLVGPALAEAAARDLRGFLIAVCGAALAIFILKSIVMAIVLLVQNQFVLNKLATFGRDLLHVYMDRPYTYHLQHNTAEMIRNIELLPAGLFVKGVLPLLHIALELMVGIGILGLLMTVNPQATLGAAALMGLSVVIFYRLIQKRVRHWGEIKVAYDGAILQWIQQGLGSIKTTKLAGSQAFFADAVEQRGLARARVLSYLNTAPLLPRLFIEIAAVAALFVLVMTSLSASEGGVKSILPAIGLFGAAAVRLMPALSKIVSSLTLLRESTATVDILYDDLGGRPPRHSAGTSSPTTARFERELRLEGISFSYPGSQTLVLDNLTLTIRRGESIALIGRSGAGKTTLADVVLGLLEPTKGRVLIDGLDVRQNLSSWQRRIGYVPQDIYLLDDTLRSNIALGLRGNEIDEAKLKRAVSLAHLDPVVAGLPQGLETVIGERGTRLSGGQRQRIGIARALYNQPDVLIMDEATSALDAETEREIGAALVGFQNVLTTIVIAHRLTTVRQCRRVVLLDSGRIAAQGTFEELMTSNPDFQRLAGVEGELSAAS